VALGDVGEGAGVDVSGISSNGEGALGYLHVVYDVPVVEANGLGLGVGRPNFDPNPAVHDGQVAGPNQLVALGDVGEGAGVDVSGVSSNGEGALGYLHVVHDVPVVEANGLGLGVGRPNFDPDPAIHDGQVAAPIQLVALGDVGEGAGVDVG